MLEFVFKHYLWSQNLVIIYIYIYIYTHTISCIVY